MSSPHGLQPNDPGVKATPRSERLVHPLLARVLHAAEAIDTGDVTRARNLVDGILNDASGDAGARERVARVFALALASCLAGDSQETGNLYLRPAGHRDMLSAFHVLAERTPFIRFGHEVANRATLRELGDAPECHLVDLGIGFGTQWMSLLDALARRTESPPRVHLTGVDLPLDDAEPARRLREVGDALQAHARECGVPFTFEGVASPVEDLDVTQLASGRDAPVVVNAAFALHHLPAGDGVTEASRSRDAVLARLAGVEPRLLTLVEPEVEHNALPFLPRVRASLHHYAAVFEVLDALLPRDLKERRVLENAFFGREVLNVVTAEGASRVERHEAHASWRKRLTGHGFTPVDVAGLQAQRDHGVPVAPLTAHARRDAVTLDWGETPLVNASAWRLASP